MDGMAKRDGQAAFNPQIVQPGSRIITMAPAPHWHQLPATSWAHETGIWRAPWVCEELQTVCGAAERARWAPAPRFSRRRHAPPRVCRSAPAPLESGSPGCPPGPKPQVERCRAAQRHASSTGAALDQQQQHWSRRAPSLWHPLPGGSSACASRPCPGPLPSAPCACLLLCQARIGSCCPSARNHVAAGGPAHLWAPDSTQRTRGGSCAEAGHRQPRLAGPFSCLDLLLHAWPRQFPAPACEALHATSVGPWGS